MGRAPTLTDAVTARFHDAIASGAWPVGERVPVEAGDYAPSVYLALALAGRLGRSVEELFGHGAAAGTDDDDAGRASRSRESGR